MLLRKVTQMFFIKENNEESLSFVHEVYLDFHLIHYLRVTRLMTLYPMLAGKTLTKLSIYIYMTSVVYLLVFVLIILIWKFHMLLIHQFV